MRNGIKRIRIDKKRVRHGAARGGYWEIKE